MVQTVSEILENHVTLEIESIDRLFLNGYVPLVLVQHTGGVLGFLQRQLNAEVFPTALIAPLTKKFVESIETFAIEQGVDLITFKNGQRKDEIAQEYLAKFPRKEGILFIGKCLEKTTVSRTIRKTNGQGFKYPWIVRGSAMVNHYLFLALREKVL